MILTCPACDTKYVVKDGAVPPGGRKVRCASCKHSWHQDPDPVDTTVGEEAPLEIASLGGPPEPIIGKNTRADPIGEVPEQAEADQMVAETPEPEAETAEFTSVNAGTGGDEPVVASEPVAMADPASWQEPQAEEGEFVGYVGRYDEEERPKRRWPLLLLALFLIAVAAAAFWFLAPPEWQERAGIAQAGASPLQLMITTSDRQPLESGNELVAISGRVFNPTDIDQKVPPIHAELRNKQSKVLIHQWTIAPPARVLAPRSSASFNSAEVDVPKGGDELTVTLG